MRLLFVLSLVACSAPPAPTPPAPTPPAPMAQPADPAGPPSTPAAGPDRLATTPAGTPTAASEDPALARADAAATRLARTLKARVVEEMGRGGPVSAVQVCNAEAPALAAEIARETGVTLGRSSLRLRNPANGGPAWVRAWLEEQGERPAAGVAPVATVADGTARVIKPIPVEAACLACHGPPESLAPDVRSELTRRYPADAATGYALGDLRGALWAEVAVQP